VSTPPSSTPTSAGVNDHSPTSGRAHRPGKREP
jgi:hypothetical protein